MTTQTMIRISRPLCAVARGPMRDRWYVGYDGIGGKVGLESLGLSVLMR